MAASTLSSQSIHDVYAEGLRYFMGEGTLQGTLAQVSSDLERRGIDYMVIDAIALMAYGYPRFTEDIDLVLTREGLEEFHRELIGLGYAPAFPGAKKRLRSTRDNVPIEVIVAGEGPGGGPPQPGGFPSPSEGSV